MTQKGIHMRNLRILLILSLSLMLAFTSFNCGGDKNKNVKPQDETKIEPSKPEVKPEPPKTEQPKVEPLREEQLQTVYFDFDKYALRADAKAALDANSALLLKSTNVVIKIEGHCDERGTVEYNLGLGEKRAKAVMDYLAGLGVAAGRMSVISYGKERPVDAGHTEDAWAKNRRAEFRVVSQ